MATYIKSQAIDLDYPMTRSVTVSSGRWNLRSILLVIALLGIFSHDLLRANAYHRISTTYESRRDIVQTNPDEFAPMTYTRIAVYTGLIAGILAGMMYLFSGGWAKVNIGTRVAFAVMIFWMLIHSIVAYWEVLPRPSELRGAKGLFLWVSCLVLFAGTDRNAWRITTRLVYVVAYVTAGIVLLNILRFQRFSSVHQAQWFFKGYLGILLWTAPWVLLSVKDANISPARLLFLAFPFAVLVLSVLQGTGRSWLIIIMIYSAVLLIKFVRLFRTRSLAYLGTVVCILLCIAGIAAYTAIDQLSSSFSLLAERFWTDTRTNQYVQFLSQVSVSDLIIGKGPRATWNWGGREYAWIDGAYTVMAFNGGLLLVISYIVIMVLPAWRVLRRRPPWEYAAPAVVLLIWALALTGLSTFTVPAVSIGHYILCIYAGRCHSYLHSRRNRLAVSQAPISFTKAAH
jgi:hypothetical protein